MAETSLVVRDGNSNCNSSPTFVFSVWGHSRVPRVSNSMDASQTNLPVVLWTSVVSRVGSSQYLALSSFVCIVIAGDVATLPTFDECHSWLDVLEPRWPGFGGLTAMPCQSLPPRPHNTSTLSPISIEASRLAGVSFGMPLTVPSWRLELLPSHRTHTTAPVISAYVHPCQPWLHFYIYSHL